MFIALLLLGVTLMIPLSAAESGYTKSSSLLGSSTYWKKFAYVYGAEGEYMDGLPQRLWMSNPDIYVPEYTAANPFCVRYSNMSVTWNPQNWTYVSFEIASFEDGSHWSVGFWERTGGAGAREVVYRLMYYDATSSAKNITVFEKILPDVTTANPVITTEYWSEDDCTMCRVFFDVQMDMYDCSYSFRIDKPFQIRVKTEYAGLTYTTEIGDVRYKSGYDSGTTDGYSDGYLDGHEAGFNVGVPVGEQNIMDNIKNYLTEKKVLLDTGTTFEALMAKVEDVGWARCIDQGLITQKLMVTLIDAPVNMVLASLNFDMFGFNVSSVVLTIFSIAVSYVLIAAVLKILPLV